MKYVLTFCSARYIVNIFDYFAWGSGTFVDVVIYFIALVFCVGIIVHLLNKEEFENEGF